MQLIDIGQVEGAFVIGTGHFLSEAMEWDEATGALRTVDTWEYKPPQSLDIPIVWNTTLLPHAPNPTGALPGTATLDTNSPCSLPSNCCPGLTSWLGNTGFLGSKVVGEPPLICSCAVLFAIKAAVLAAREEHGMPGWFKLDVPATPEVVQRLCPKPAA
eukprot:SAG22_NODE_3257_length_1825_cov_1.590962_1_plen_159_part_00